MLSGGGPTAHRNCCAHTWLTHTHRKPRTHIGNITGTFGTHTWHTHGTLMAHSWHTHGTLMAHYMAHYMAHWFLL